MPLNNIIVIKKTESFQFCQGVVAKEHRTQVLVYYLDVGSSLVVTLVSLSKTLNYCFSPPRGKWVPVRAEIVLNVNDWLGAQLVTRSTNCTPQGVEMVERHWTQNNC